MATTTTQLTLTKPIGSELRQLSIWNANWQNVDNAFKTDSIGAAGAQVAMLRDTAMNPTYTVDGSKMVNLTPTWNNASSTFDLLFANVTDTLSQPASRLLELQVGGVSQFRVTKAGAGTLAGTMTAADATLNGAGAGVVTKQLSSHATPAAGYTAIYAHTDGTFHQVTPDGVDAFLNSSGGGDETVIFSRSY